MSPPAASPQTVLPAGWEEPAGPWEEPAGPWEEPCGSSRNLVMAHDAGHTSTVTTVIAILD